MKIKDIMQTSILQVSENTPIKEVARMFFSVGVSSLPVTHNKKLVGIITEEDILLTMSPIKTSSKNTMNDSVSSIMNKNVISIHEDDLITKAQEIMLANKFSKLPVVDKNGNLIAVITQGDIFRQILKEEIPQLERDRYAEFVANNYDVMVNWDHRYDYEFPALLRIFNRHNVKKILDLGVWTGEYSSELAREGLSVIGLDHNPLMIKIANEKRNKLPEKIKKNLKFELSDFSNIPQLVDQKMDAVLCMGSSLPYIPYDLGEMMKGVKKVLRQKDGVLIFQVYNMNRIIKHQRRLLSFNIQELSNNLSGEHLSLEFYDPKPGNKLIHHVIIFDSDGENWRYRGMSTIEIKNIGQKEIEKALKEAGFRDIAFSGNQGEYQGEFGQISFVKPFDPETSEWMNVIAYT